MAINRFSKTTPVQFVLPKTPLEPLIGALESKQRRYDQGFALADELSNQYIDALEQDRARANAITGGWQERIDNIVEGYEGDYSQVYKDLYGLKRDIKKSFSPQGEAGAIQLSKKNYTDRLKAERDRLAKGDITEKQLEWWQQNTLGGYTGIGEMDPVTGAYNVLDPENIAKYVNPDELLHEALGNIAAQEGGEEVVSIGGQWMVKNGTKYEVITPERVQSAVMGTLGNNPEYLNYVSQLAGWQGLDVKDTIMKDITSRAATMTNLYAKGNLWTTMDYKANQFALKQMGIDAIKNMMQPSGDTRPGFSQNSSLSQFTIPVPTGDAAEAFGRGLAGPSFLSGNKKGPTYGTTESPEEFWQETRRELPEHLREYYTATYVDVRKTPGYDQMSDLEKNKLLAEKFNEKIANKTYAQTSIPLGQDFIQEYNTAWEAGDAIGANYYPIKSNGTLGEVRTGKQIQIDPKVTKPYKVDIIDGKVGLIISTEDGEYLVDNTNAHDRITSNMKPVAVMREPLRTGEKIKDYVFNFPMVDPNTGQIAGYVPAKMDVDLDKDLNRSTTITFPGGQRQVLDEGSTTNLEAVLVGAASSNVHRGFSYSSPWQQKADTKGVGDILPFLIGQ